MRKLSLSTRLNLAVFLLMTGVGLIVSLLPLRIFSSTGSFQSVGLIATVFAAAYLAAQLPMGLWADRFGGRWPLVGGYFLCAAAGLLFFASPLPLAVFAGRMLQGVGEAPVWALGPALLAAAYPTRRGQMIGVYNAVIHAGLALGPLLSLLLVADHLDDYPFLLFTLLCLSGGLLLLRLPAGSAMQSPARGDREQSGHRLSGLLKSRRFILILPAVALFGASYGVFISVLPVLLAQRPDFDADSAKLLFAGFYASVGLMQLAAGILSDRWGRRSFMVVGLAAAGLGLGSCLLVQGGWTYLPLFLASSGLGAFGVCALADLNDSAGPGQKGAVSGLYYLFWGSGYSLWPLIAGSASAAGVEGALLGLAALLCLAALALPLLPRDN